MTVGNSRPTPNLTKERTMPKASNPTVMPELTDADLKAATGGMYWDDSDRRSTNVDDHRLRDAYAAKQAKERADAGPDFMGFGNFGA
jgi:hypothetical protein